MTGEMMMRVLVLVATAALIAQAAVAQNAPSAKAKAIDPDKLVCHREEVTGSLAANRRTCHTRAEWEAQARAYQGVAERLVDAGRVTGCTVQGGCP